MALDVTHESLPQTDSFALISAIWGLPRLELGQMAQIRADANSQMTSNRNLDWTILCDDLNGSFGLSFHPCRNTGGYDFYHPVELFCIRAGGLTALLGLATALAGKGKVRFSAALISLLNLLLWLMDAVGQ